MERRHVILVGVMVAAGLLALPAGPVLGRAPELLVPALVAYGMIFLLAFRMATGRSLAGEALAAAGVRSRSRPRRGRGGAGRRIGGFLLGMSTLLATTAGALWVRSYRVAERVEWSRWDVLGVTPSRWVRRLHDGVTFSSDRGALMVERERMIVLDPQYVVNKEIQVLPKPWHRLVWTDGIPGRFRPRVLKRPNLLDAVGIEYGDSPLPQRLPGDPRESRVWVLVPYRLVAAAAAFAPLCAGALALVRLRPAKPGHCANCGYDLRATPGRCPECGEDTRDGAGMASETKDGVPVVSGTHHA